MMIVKAGERVSRHVHQLFFCFESVAVTGVTASQAETLIATQFAKIAYPAKNELQVADFDL